MLLDDARVLAAEVVAAEAKSIVASMPAGDRQATHNILYSVHPELGTVVDTTTRVLQERLAGVEKRVLDAPAGLVHGELVVLARLRLLELVVELGRA